MEVIKLPDWSKLNDSKEKVEKVVKPPHRPVFKNNSRFLLKPVFFKAVAEIRPITNAPITFIIKVLRGNPFSIFIGINPIR